MYIPAGDIGNKAFCGSSSCHSSSKAGSSCRDGRLGELGRVRGACAVTGILLARSVSFQAHGLIPSQCAATVPPWYTVTLGSLQCYLSQECSEQLQEMH